MEKNIYIANSPKTSPQELHKLSKSEDELVRAAVASNPKTTKTTLNYLAKDSSILVAKLAEQQLNMGDTNPQIHPTAIISEKSKIGNGVKIGPYTIIHDNTVIGDRTIIGPFCEIGVPCTEKTGPLIIRNDSLIRSHSIFYAGSTFGERLITGHRATVREFTQAGKNLQIGTLSDIQGRCKIGDFVRLHSNVHIGQHSTIGNFVWIFPYVVLTNDPHPPSETRLGVKVKDFVAISTMSVILPGVTINEGVLIGAHSLVNRDINPNMVAVGSPAKEVCETSKIKHNDGQSQAYPWRQHFHRGYPEEIVNQWISELRK